MTGTARSRIGSVGRWLAPSVAAACGGALAAGLVDAESGSDLIASVAALGFVALLALPALLVVSVALRGLIRAWRPRQLATTLVEDGGGAPALVGWLAVLLGSIFAIVAAVSEGTHYLATSTGFQPAPVAFSEAALAGLTVAALIIVSRPVARVISAIARVADRRWRRSGRRTLLAPRVIIGATLVVATAFGSVMWLAVVRPALGPIDGSLLYAPAIGAAITVIIHLIWDRARRVRVISGWCVVALNAVAIAMALVSVEARPTATLEIWGDRPLAGLCIDTLFDLDKIRARVALSEFQPVDRPGAEHPDIVLITIDTVRADHTPPYGGNAIMPTLGGLGEHGTVFEWAFSPSNVTRRSIPSIVIGLAPTRVRGRVVGWALRVDPRHVLLAERLRAGGYDTAGFMCCQGFWGEEAHTGLQRGMEHVEIEPNGTKLAALARTWLDARERSGTHRPLFVWIHILEPHNWTAIAGEPHNDDERQRFYDRVLGQCDVMLAEILRPFAKRAPEHAPIVVVTADHGEALGEHGHEFHSTDLYDSQLHVPLVIAGPGIVPQRVSETVSLTDLVPTLMELAGFQPPSGISIDGHSIADLALGKRAALPDSGMAFAAMIKDRSNPGGITALVKGTWKLIDNGTSLELYDLATDPNEHRNVGDSRREIRDQLGAIIKVKQAEARTSPFE